MWIENVAYHDDKIEPSKQLSGQYVNGEGTLCTIQGRVPNLKLRRINILIISANLSYL